MKLQLSPTRIVKDALTVWQEPGPEVDLVMDLRNLTFAPNSLEAIYAFHVLDHFSIEEAEKAVRSWFLCLKKPAPLYVVVDDFEFIARGFLGGDITIEEINRVFVHPSQFTRENLFNLIHSAGFDEPGIRQWFGETNLFPAHPHELVLSADKT